jgi:uncharacterized caspase-like protein
MPKENHYAVVVGVDEYPRFRKGKQNLNCPQTDARAIRDWLVRPDGGNLPPAESGAEESPNLTLITREVPTGRQPPCPVVNEIVRAIKTTAETFYNKYSQLDAAIWNTSRLYLFFSGHGLDAEGSDAVLLGADAEDNLFFHLSVQSIVNKFKVAKTFREIVVWTDCCRTASAITIVPVILDLTPYRYTGAGDVQVFFARASKTQQPAYEPPKEKLMEIQNSFFTWALLEGLNGGVVRASDGVSSQNLRPYLEARVPQLSQTYYETVQQHPDITPDDDIEFVSASAHSLVFQVRLTVKPGSGFTGLKNVRIFSHLENPATAEEHPVTSVSSGVFEATLSNGLYLVTTDLNIPGAPTFTFQVLGSNVEKEI